jgi:hypothetical protein
VTPCHLFVCREKGFKNSRLARFGDKVTAYGRCIFLHEQMSAPASQARPAEWCGVHKIKDPGHPMQENTRLLQVCAV